MRVGLLGLSSKNKNKRNQLLEAPLPVFVPQIVPDKVPNIFHFKKFFRLFFFGVFVCVFFFHQIASGRRPNLTLTLTPAKAPTQARLQRAFWKN